MRGEVQNDPTGLLSHPPIIPEIDLLHCAIAPYLSLVFIMFSFLLALLSFIGPGCIASPYHNSLTGVIVRNRTSELEYFRQ